MLEFVIGIVILAVLWKLRKAFYGQSEVFTEQIDIKVKDQQVELQDDYSQLVTRITEKKASQGGKWYSLKDLNDLMQHTKK